MNKEMNTNSHPEKVPRLMMVNKPKFKSKWTNISTILIDKYCKYHDKICKFTEKGVKCKERRGEDYKKCKIMNLPTNENIICKTCNVELSSDLFYNNPKIQNGKSNICKPCKKEYDKNRNDTWERLFIQAFRTSLRSHGNINKLNPISLEECKELFIKQNGRCKHCRVELTSHQGTVTIPNYFRASLDRIDTNIVGYGNGNAQWLCVSCNKGKCTMPDEIHKAKFLINENQEILKYDKELLEMNEKLISNEKEIKNIIMSKDEEIKNIIMLKDEEIKNIIMTKDEENKNKIKTKDEEILRLNAIIESKEKEISNIKDITSYDNIVSSVYKEIIREKISKTLKEKIASGEIPKPPRKQKSIRVEISEKKCTKCSEIKTIDNFHIKNDTADGYQPYCRLCVNNAKKNFRENMKNEIFACDMCNKVYCLKDSLTRHKKEKH